MSSEPWTLMASNPISLFLAEEKVRAPLILDNSNYSRFESSVYWRNYQMEELAATELADWSVSLFFARHDLKIKQASKKARQADSHSFPSERA